MKSLSAIEIDFQSANRRADELDEIAGELRSLSGKELESSLTELSGGWKGEAASAYIRKGMALQEKIARSAKDLEQTAATIRSIARRTYQAEMAAYRLAQKRIYGQ